MRNLDSDKTRYLWRNGRRVRVKTREELIKEGVNVRGAGLPGAERKWFEGRFILGRRAEEEEGAEGGEGEKATASA